MRMISLQSVLYFVVPVVLLRKQRRLPRSTDQTMSRPLGESATLDTNMIINDCSMSEAMREGISIFRMAG